MDTFEEVFGAGESKIFPGGRYFLLITAASEVSITFYGPRKKVIGSANDVLSGFIVDFKDKIVVNFSIYSATAQTIKCQVSNFAEVDYKRNQGDIDTINNPVKLSSPDTIISSADVAAAASSQATLFIGNSNYVELHIKNPANSGGSIRVGGSNVSATIGIELAPGETYILNTCATVYCYNLHTSTINVQRIAISHS